MNFDAPLTDSVKMSGNIGVRVVKTEIDVFQNLIYGAPRNVQGTLRYNF